MRERVTVLLFVLNMQHFAGIMRYFLSILYIFVAIFRLVLIFSFIFFYQYIDNFIITFINKNSI